MIIFFSRRGKPLGLLNWKTDKIYLMKNAKFDLTKGELKEMESGKFIKKTNPEKVDFVVRLKRFIDNLSGNTIKQETVQFTVTYIGEPEAMKTEALLISLSGIEGVIRESFSVLNNRKGDINIRTEKIETGLEDRIAYEITVESTKIPADKYGIEKVVGTIGFLGKG
jgi:hypothetical protein